jgi:hypothetical protein
MVPFQLVMRRSSPSSRPYEQASNNTVLDNDLFPTLRNQHGSLTGAETLLALLELLQQAEVAGNFGTHVCCRLGIVFGDSAGICGLERPLISGLQLCDEYKSKGLL